MNAQSNAVNKTVPFSKLFLSPDNMRKSNTSKSADLELRASIEAHGIIQNLVVSAKSKKGYGVQAGGRRFTQFQSLVDSKIFSKDDLVPVLVLPEGASSKEISLIENLVREDSHPVDEFEAFLFLVESDNFSVSDLAKRFGRTQRYINQRMLLGGVCPELRELCRKGKFGIEILEAFTVSTDHKKQVESYNAFKGDDYRFCAGNIKAFLTNSALTSDHKLVKFITLNAYKKAGGTTSRDLFGNVTYIDDRDLLNSMVDEKMSDIVSELKKVWGWAEYPSDFQEWKVSQYQVIGKELKNAPKKLVSELDQKMERLKALEDMPWGDFTDEEQDNFDTEFDEVERRISELEDELSHFSVFVKPEMAFGGVLVALDKDGTVKLYEGLVNSEDLEKLEIFRNPDLADPEVESELEKKESIKPMYNQALSQDIAAYRKVIAKVAVSKTVNLGSDLLMFDLCYSVFMKNGGLSSCQISIDDTSEESSKNDISTGKAQQELDAVFSKLDRSWVSNEKLTSFKAFRELTPKTKKVLCAYCASYSLVSYGVGNGETEFTNYLFKEADLEVSEYFRPTSFNFFKRIPEPHFTTLANEIMGLDWSEENNSMKKSQIAERLEAAVSSDGSLSDWMPKGF